VSYGLYQIEFRPAPKSALRGKDQREGIVISHITTYDCVRSGPRHAARCPRAQAGTGTPMVSNPPPRPPGRNPTRGDPLWCAKHQAWATLRPNGKYLCPFGHTLKRGKATG
jgi:hypothetical protein